VYGGQETVSWGAWNDRCRMMAPGGKAEGISNLFILTGCADRLPALAFRRLDRGRPPVADRLAGAFCHGGRVVAEP
jgi:hypothetical protein